MTCLCPRCGNDRIATKDYARRTACTIGAIAGAAGGVTGIVSGAELGALIGMLSGPLGAACGGVAGAILGALVGGVAGGSAGATLGEIVDGNVLNNFVCLTCEFSFGKTSGEALQELTRES